MSVADEPTTLSIITTTPVTPVTIATPVRDEPPSYNSLYDNSDHEVADNRGYSTDNTDSLLADLRTLAAFIILVSLVFVVTAGLRYVADLADPGHGGTGGNNTTS